MKQLLLMRHAKSSWKDTSLYDHDRPLNNRGKRDAPRMGQKLMDEELIPEIILCSTATRARETVERLLETCEFSGDLKYIEDLYHADYATYLELLSELDPEIECAMIVGHNPEMDSFLQYVCDDYDHLPTATIAWIKFSCENWNDLSEDAEGQLLKLWKPREIDY